MKTLPILATSLLALLVVLGPTAAFAATTLTVAPSQGTYSGSATITITGTVSPTPTVPSSVVLTVKSPSGATVRISSNAVSTTNGAYSDSWVGGGLMSVSGTYTVNATWGASGSSASAVTSFAYTAGSGGCTVNCGVAGGANLVVLAVANSPTWPGQKESLAVLVQWNNGSLACNNPCFTTVHFYTPSGTLVTIYNPSNSSTNPITVHRGFFIWTWTVPSSYPDGLYAIHAWASLTSGGVTYQGQGLTSFTVNSKLANADQLNSILTAVQSIKSSVDTITSQGVQVSGTTITDIQTNVNGLKTSMSGVSSSLATLTTTVNGFSSTMNTIQSNLATLLSDISSLQTTIGSLNGLSAQITSLQNAISSNQTYVLVVAALAAITLVLELAILVRKLS